MVFSGRMDPNPVDARRHIRARCFCVGDPEKKYAFGPAGIGRSTASLVDYGLVDLFVVDQFAGCEMDAEFAGGALGRV